MIVNPCNAGWQVIYQTAHGLLAGQLALGFRDDLRPNYWCETLAAIIQHDDYKSEIMGRPRLTEAGAPMDFTQHPMSEKDRFEESQRRIEAAYARHRWQGLLQSMHTDCLYRDQAVSHQLKKLLTAEAKHRREVLVNLNCDPWELHYAYEFLHWCDRCSLILAQQELPALRRRLEIIHALTDETYTIGESDDQTIGIDPWPFALDEFEVHVECRVLHRLHYDNEGHLQSELDSAKVQLSGWTLRFR